MLEEQKCSFFYYMKGEKTWLQQVLVPLVKNNQRIQCEVGYVPSVMKVAK